MNIEEKIARLERKVEELERKAAMNDPFKPIMPWPTQPTWTIPNACQVCGLEFKGAMGYVCNNPKCPSGVVYSNSHAQ